MRVRKFLEGDVVMVGGEGGGRVYSFTCTFIDSFIVRAESVQLF